MFHKKKKVEQTGRTPSGGQRNTAVFSYYSSRSGQENPRAGRAKASEKPRRSVWWIQYLPSLLSVALVAGCILYVTTLTSNARIQVIEAAGRQSVIQKLEVYERASAELLKRSLFNKSKLSINTDKLARELQAQFPELGEVVVMVPLISRRPIIKIQPAIPALIVSGQGGSYIIDTAGRPVLRASDLASSIKDPLPVVRDDSGTEIHIGSQMLPTDLVAFIAQVHAQSEAKKLDIESYVLPAAANELHIRVRGEGYFIKLNTEADARQQVGTYLALNEKLESEGVTPTEYIDVRVEERAYYK